MCSKCAITLGEDWMRRQNSFPHRALWAGADMICYRCYIVERTWARLGFNSGRTTCCVILDETVNITEAQISSSVNVEIITCTCWGGLDMTVPVNHPAQHLAFSRHSISRCHSSAFLLPQHAVSFLILTTSL